MRRSAVTILIVGRASEELEVHLAAMKRHQWEVELTDPSTLFSKRATSPSAVVIDQSSLPSATDAFKLATRSRSEIAVPVVVLSSLKMPAIAKAAQAAGCICVSAPCRPSTVIAGVTSAIAMAGGEPWRNLAARSDKRGSKGSGALG